MPYSHFSFTQHCVWNVSKKSDTTSLWPNSQNIVPDLDSQKNGSLRNPVNPKKNPIMSKGSARQNGCWVVSMCKYPQPPSPTMVIVQFLNGWTLTPRIGWPNQCRVPTKHCCFNTSTQLWWNPYYGDECWLIKLLDRCRIKCGPTSDWVNNWRAHLCWDRLQLSLQNRLECSS